MKRFVSIGLIVFPALAVGQEGAVPTAVIGDLAKDLAELQRAVQLAQQRQVLEPRLGAVGGYTEVPLYPSEITVTGRKTTLRAGASTAAPSLLVVDQGQQFRVVDKASNWYAVELPSEVRGYRSAWIQAADAVPAVWQGSGMAVGLPLPSSAELLFQELAGRAAKLRDSYDSNPYIGISGFVVNVGVPPSLSINFEFRKASQQPPRRP